MKIDVEELLMGRFKVTVFDETFNRLNSDGQFRFSDFLWFLDYLDRNDIGINDDFDESTEDYEKLNFLRDRSFKFMSESKQSGGVNYV